MKENQKLKELMGEKWAKGMDGEGERTFLNLPF